MSEEIIPDGFKKSYLKQFIIYYLIVVTAMGIFGFTELFMLPRTSRQFQINDPTISKPFKKKEIVTTPLCVILSIGLPTIIVFFVCISKGYKSTRDSQSMPLPISVLPSSIRTLQPTSYRLKPSFWLSYPPVHLFHCSMLEFWLSISIMAAIINVIKLAISNFRPDFMDRCKPKIPIGGSTDSWLTIANCTNTDYTVLYEGYKSTPSGHSGFICTGMYFLYKWLDRYLPWRRRWLLLLGCPVLAVFVMWSRVVDNRHHWYDVISGGVLGVAVHVIFPRLLL